jgi:protein subunit release factor A
MKSKRELLFSVTAADCDWAFSHGQGAGGQARNKSLTAVHCTHKASGARAYSQDGRSQKDNKSDAFVKMCNTAEFKAWHKREVWKKMGVLDEIDRAVEAGMTMQNLRLEVRVDGKWVQVEFNAPLDLIIDPENLTAQ